VCFLEQLPYPTLIFDSEPRLGEEIDAAVERGGADIYIYDLPFPG
jgi:hypothetical protein